MSMGCRYNETEEETPIGSLGAIGEMVDSCRSNARLESIMWEQEHRGKGRGCSSSSWVGSERDEACAAICMVAFISSVYHLTSSIETHLFPWILSESSGGGGQDRVPYGVIG